MSTLIILGTGILCLGVGLFIGKIITKSSQHHILNNTEKKPSIFDKWVQTIKGDMAQKSLEKKIRKDLETKARMQALENMQPTLIKHMEEQERKKLTGEDKAEKMAKFAKAFSMGGEQGNFNTTNKLNNMLGIQQPQAQPQPIQQVITPIQPTYVQPIQQPIQQVVQPPQPTYVQQQPKSQFDINKILGNSSGPQFDINKILGNSGKNTNFESVNEKVLGRQGVRTFEDVNNQILGKPQKSKKTQTASEKIAEFLR